MNFNINFYALVHFEIFLLEGAGEQV